MSYMDYMDIDDIEVVPDTPDRAISTHTSINNRSGGSSSCRVIDKERFNEKLKNETREKGNSVAINGSRRLFVSPENSTNSPSFMPRNQSTFNDSLPIVENGHKDKGKAKFNGNTNRSTIQESNSFVDLTEQNGRSVFGKASAHVSKQPGFSNNDFSKSNNTVKLGPRSDREKGVVIGGQSKDEKISSLLDSTPPRVHKHKRLVRNGCISPINIEKSKHVAETHETRRVEKDKRADVGMMSSDGLSSRVDIKDIVAEAKDSHRFKGKGVSRHSSFFNEADTRSRHLSNRSSIVFKDATGTSKESDGWKTTHNTTRKADPTLVDHGQHISRGKGVSSSTIDQHMNRGLQTDNKNNGQSSNINNHFDDLDIDWLSSVSPPPDTMSRLSHNLGQFKERAQLTKRQREGVVLSNKREHDVPGVSDVDMMSRSTREEPSTSRSTRNKNRRAASTSCPVIAIDELSPQVGNDDVSTNRNSNEGVRALQLEADEILARELQEQLYNEELESSLGFDQQEQRSHAIHTGTRPAFRPASRVSLSNPRPSVSRNHPHIRGGAQAQTSTSARLARLRSRFPGRPRTISSATTSRNSIFPSSMDVDMRMQILEALEAFNDMDLPNDFLPFNDMGLPSELLQLGREFNENDYEMLLALDDNNHQHGGATHAQINNLPQSTVQAENLQECSICLETPTIGETIRHLPCLHRFHKDCIDEWLRRKTSCPVCKSSVT
ncbi:uncharacterized protein [Rutidosis leptorrhynchoides]|uniref:uncharacterized protein isoform X2 n=1 Tax=Rutidosis leptorrhynchoides TaxID=125765 RepID=UPI003A99D819